MEVKDNNEQYKILNYISPTTVLKSIGSISYYLLTSSLTRKVLIGSYLYLNGVSLITTMGVLPTIGITTSLLIL